MNRVPGIRNDQQQQVRVPIVQLAGCQVQYKRLPDGNVAMLVGPVILALAFTPEDAKEQAQQMRAAASSVVVPTIGGV